MIEPGQAQIPLGSKNSRFLTVLYSKLERDCLDGACLGEDQRLPFGSLRPRDLGTATPSPDSLVRGNTSTLGFPLFTSSSFSLALLDRLYCPIPQLLKEFDLVLEFLLKLIVSTAISSLHPIIEAQTHVYVTSMRGGLLAC